MLSIRERVIAAIEFLESETPGISPSVVDVCKAADVNRANLYEHYPDLIKRIQKRNRRVLKKPPDEVEMRPLPSPRQDDNKELKQRYDAALVMCLELMAEIHNLRVNKRVRQRRG